MKIGVIGAGAWGTALAQVAAAGGEEALLWAREPEVVESINERHENELFLKGIALSPAIRATGDLEAIWPIATPSWSSRRPSICARCSAACRPAASRSSSAPRGSRTRPAC